jgi:hypothetical protein
MEDPADDEQIPPELASMVALYSRLAPADQARMLASLDLVSDWAACRLGMVEV